MADPGCSPCAAREAARAAAALKQMQQSDIGWLTNENGPIDHTNHVVIDGDGVLALALVRNVPNVWPSRMPLPFQNVFNEPQTQLAVGAKFVAQVTRRTRSHAFVNGYFLWIAQLDDEGQIVENWHGATAEMLQDQRIAPHPGWAE